MKSRNKIKRTLEDNVISTIIFILMSIVFIATVYRSVVSGSAIANEHDAASSTTLKIRLTSFFMSIFHLSHILRAETRVEVN